jgi:hypothetical protein
VRWGGREGGRKEGDTRKTNRQKVMTEEGKEGRAVEKG